MSKYTTGEVAKLCGVTVRTVQYYDTRGILVPSELSEGGRRLYSEDDVRRMKIICFLRDLGLPIESIRQLLSEDDPGSVISLLLDQQEAVLKGEIDEREEKLQKLTELKTGLKSMSEFSVESIGDIAYFMTNRKKLRNLRIFAAITAIPFGILQWSSIILWIMKGIWWPFLVWVAVTIPYVAVFSRWYLKRWPISARSAIRSSNRRSEKDCGQDIPLPHESLPVLRAAIAGSAWRLQRKLR